MDVRNCRKCGKLFNYVDGPITCIRCREELEEKFQEVKKFVQDNPRVSISIVSEECEVEVNQIKHWIREERLQFADDSPIKVSCERCGTMIGSGKFCNKCKVDMANNLSDSIKKPVKPVVEKPKDPREKSRMRFLDKKD